MKSNYLTWTIGRTIFTAIVFSVIALCWMYVGKAKPIPQTAIYPETETQLKQRYDAYNESYFHNNLPHDVHLVYGYMDGNIAQTYRLTTGKFVIAFNPDYDKCTTHVAQSMFHEMCHIATWDKEFDVHGSKFQACMLNLAEHGAFEGVW